MIALQLRDAFASEVLRCRRSGGYDAPCVLTASPRSCSQPCRGIFIVVHCRLTWAAPRAAWLQTATRARSADRPFLAEFARLAVGRRLGRM